MQQVLKALAANAEAKDSLLYIYCDGAKESATVEDLRKIEEVRSIAKSENRFNKVINIEQIKNKGLANSIIDGVTDIVNRHGTVIVLEDDIVTTPYFLRYMNEALIYYKDDNRVVSIHGYIYPVKQPLPEIFFLRGTDCWGWATWRRGWAHFNSDGEWLLSQLRRRKLTNKFDFNGTYNYTSMLKGQIAGINDSWAIRWYASAFLQNKLTLYPGRSLVQNIGNDAFGTHCGSNDNFDVSLSANPIRIGGIPVEDSKVGRKAFVKYFRSLHSWQNPLIVFVDLFHRLTRYL
jgi:hypothetical protein